MTEEKNQPTEEQTQLDEIRAHIAALPVDERATVERHLTTMRTYMEAMGPLAAIALCQLGAEMAAAPDGKLFADA